MSRLKSPLLQSPAPLRPADLPERRLPFWKMAGPGAVLVGLSIGAGEIVIWPRIAAEYGGEMIWAAVVGVFLQLWVNLEIGRWTIATGETVFSGCARLWPGFAPLLVLLIVLGFAAPGWAMASGLALKGLLVGPAYGTAADSAGLSALLGTQTFWTLLSYGAVALVLFGPRMMYQSMERVIEVLVILVTVGMCVVAVVAGTADAWREMGAGLANIARPRISEGMSIRVFFGALVFAGAGGLSNLFYSFYLRDKNIGMGGRIPALGNPLRGRAEPTPATGFRYPESAENGRRFRRWMSYVRTDQVLFFFGLNTFTILLFIFGALAVLHPRGIVPAPNALIFDQAAILGEVWGLPGRGLFLLVGIATLFGTQLVIVDGVARSLADIVYTSVPRARRRDLGWWYLLFAGGGILAGGALTAVMEGFEVSNLGFLFNAAYMGGFGMALYVPLLLVMNLRLLPPSARPGPVTIVAMGVASLIYGGFAVLSLLWEVGIL